MNDFKGYFKIAPVYMQTSSTEKRSFEVAYMRLKSAGYRLADPELALTSFLELRSAYAEALDGLAKYWLVAQRTF